MKKTKTAIVYDWIDKWGGVERILLILHDLFPQAPFYTSYRNHQNSTWANKLLVRQSFIQKLPSFIKKHRPISVPFYPFAFESFNFSNFDLVISISSSFAKSVITRPETLHINFCLTPTRFLWHQKDLYVTSGVAKLYLKYLRRWDQIAAQRPDQIISISKTVQKRVKEIYGRESDMIYPPFDIDYWNNIKKGMSFARTDLKYYLIVSRLEPYKRVDLAVQTFHNLPEKKLIIVGKGTQKKKLKKSAPCNVQFLEQISDQQLGYLYRQAEALIMPQEEDFGYAALEAQFFGCPVIAYKKGGATETIIDKITGLFFEEQSVEVLFQTIKKYDKIKVNFKETALTEGPKNVEKFAKEIFKIKLVEVINKI